MTAPEIAECLGMALSTVSEMAGDGSASAGSAA